MLLVVVGRFGLRDVDGQPHPHQAVEQLAACPLGSVKQPPLDVAEAIGVDLGYSGFNSDDRQRVDAKQKSQPVNFFIVNGFEVKSG